MKVEYNDPDGGAGLLLNNNEHMHQDRDRHNKKRPNNAMTSGTSVAGKYQKTREFVSKNKPMINSQTNPLMEKNQDLQTELIKRDQEYLKINDTSNEGSSLVISDGILPMNNPPSQSNKRFVKQGLKAGQRQNKIHLNDILSLLVNKKAAQANKHGSGNKGKKLDTDHALETTLEQLLKLRELGKEASQSASSEKSDDCVI